MPRNTAAGFRHSWLGFIDVDGMLLGSTTSAPAAGSSTNGGMLKIRAVKRAPMTIPDPDSVIVTGDDGEIMHEYDFPSIATRGFVVEVAEEDLTFAGLLNNVPVTARAGGFWTVTDRINTPQYNVCGILQSRARDDVVGVLGWTAAIFTSATARYLGRQEFNERTAALFRFFVRPNPGQNAPWGTSFVDSSGNLIQGRYIPFNNLAYPITMHAFKGSGAVAAFNVDRQPVSVAQSSAAVEKSDVNIASVTSVAPYQITLSSNAISGGRGVFCYQYQDGV